MKKYPGFLVAFEGIDGSGKTTLSNLVYREFVQKIPDTILTKEPGGTAIGQKIRALVHDQKLSPCSEFLLFAADRAEHIRQIVAPALDRGALVISDRMADSSRAYQGYGRGLDRDYIENVVEWVMGGIKPDLVVYARIDPKIAYERVVQRNQALTPFEQENADFYIRVSQGFDTLFAGRENVLMLDAARPLEELVAACVAYIEGKSYELFNKYLIHGQ